MRLDAHQMPDDEILVFVATQHQGGGVEHDSGAVASDTGDLAEALLLGVQHLPTEEVERKSRDCGIGGDHGQSAIHPHAMPDPDLDECMPRSGPFGDRGLHGPHGGEDHE